MLNYNPLPEKPMKIFKHDQIEIKLRNDQNSVPKSGKQRDSKTQTFSKPQIKRERNKDSETIERLTFGGGGGSGQMRGRVAKGLRNVESAVNETKGRSEIYR